MSVSKIGKPLNPHINGSSKLHETLQISITGRKEKQIAIQCERERERADVDMWLLTVMRGTPWGLERTRWRRVSALWTEVVLMRDVTVLAKEPMTAITTFLGMPFRWSFRAAHFIVPDIFTADDHALNSSCLLFIFLRIGTRLSRFPIKTFMDFGLLTSKPNQSALS